MKKLYTEVVYRQAKKMYHCYMQGGTPTIEGADLIAFLFDLPEDKVQADINKDFQRMLNKTS